MHKNSQNHEIHKKNHKIHKKITKFIKIAKNHKIHKNLKIQKIDYFWRKRLGELGFDSIVNIGEMRHLKLIFNLSVSI